MHELSPKLTNSSLETKIIEVTEEEDDVESINLDVDPQTASLEAGVNGLASVDEGEDVFKQAAADWKDNLEDESHKASDKPEDTDIPGNTHAGSEAGKDDADLVSDGNPGLLAEASHSGQENVLKINLKLWTLEDSEK